MLEDLAKFATFWMSIIIGMRRYRPQVDAVVGAITGGVGLTARAATRLIDFNVVAYLRPLFAVIIGLQLTLLVIGLLPMVLLSYYPFALAIGFSGVAVMSMLLARYSQMLGVHPIHAVDPLFADDDQILAFGPNHRFSVRNFVSFPAALVAQGLVLIVAALLLKALYGTSTIFCWIIALSGLCSVMIGISFYEFLVTIARGIVSGPGDWAESAMGRLAKAILDPALLGIDKSNVAELLPKSLVNPLKKVIDDFEAGYHKWSVPVFIVLAFTVATMSVVAVAFLIVTLFIFGMFTKGEMRSGNASLIEAAKNRIVSAQRLISSVAVIVFVARWLELGAFRLHASPVDILPIAFVWSVTALLKEHLCLLFIAAIILFSTFKWLNKLKKFDADQLALPKVLARIAFGVAALWLIVGVAELGGLHIFPDRSFFDRYEHPSTESLHCLNGKQDWDEAYTDMGPSCSPQRQKRDANNTAAYRHAGESPFQIRPVTCGNILRCSWCGTFPSTCGMSSDDDSSSTQAPARQPPVAAPPRREHTAPREHSVESPMMMARADTHQGRSSKGLRPEYEPFIERASALYSVDASLIRAVIHTESRYNPNAVSRVGARGLMQLMPRTAAGLGVTNSFDPEQNIMGGTRYLRRGLDICQNDLSCTLARYNGGPRGMFSAQARQYAVNVLRRYEQYRSGQIRDLNPPSPSRSTAPQYHAVAEDPSVNADTCAGFSDPIREIMRSRGRCP